MNTDEDLTVEDFEKAMIYLVESFQFRKVLLIADYDQLDMLSTSFGLKNQVAFIKFLLYDDAFDNVLMIVGNPHDQKFSATVEM